MEEEQSPQDAGGASVPDQTPLSARVKDIITRPSNLFMTAASMFALWWVNQTPEQQAAILPPALQPYAAFATAVCGVLLRELPPNFFTDLFKSTLSALPKRGSK